jgi:hypothetical protein
MPTVHFEVHFEVLLDGAGTIDHFLEAAVEAASRAVKGGTASVFWNTEADCSSQNVVSDEDHIKAVINGRPVKRLKFQESSSSLELTRAPSPADAIDLQSALVTEAELAPHPLHAFQKPPGDALCCPALEQLILQKLPLHKVCVQHVQKFLRRVHPTAAMIKQLSFQFFDGCPEEFLPPRLIISGATIGRMHYSIIKKTWVLYYRSDNKRYLFYNWDGTNTF